MQINKSSDDNNECDFFGQEVTLSGLSDSTLNGLYAKVTQKLDTVKGRYAVSMVDSAAWNSRRFVGRVLSVRPQNLRLSSALTGIDTVRFKFECFHGMQKSESYARVTKWLEEMGQTFFAAPVYQQIEFCNCPELVTESSLISLNSMCVNLALSLDHDGVLKMWQVRQLLALAVRLGGGEKGIQALRALYKSLDDGNERAEGNNELLIAIESAAFNFIDTSKGAAKSCITSKERWSFIYRCISAEVPCNCLSHMIGTSLSKKITKTSSSTRADVNMDLDPFFKLPAPQMSPSGTCRNWLHIELRLMKEPLISRGCPKIQLIGVVPDASYVGLQLFLPSKASFCRENVDEALAELSTAAGLGSWVLKNVVEKALKPIPYAEGLSNFRPKRITTKCPTLFRGLLPLSQQGTVVEWIDPRMAHGQSENSKLVEVMSGVMRDAQKIMEDISDPNKSDSGLPRGLNGIDTSAENWNAKNKPKLNSSMAERIPDLACACGGCGSVKPYSELKMCGRCEKEMYCSSECQRRDWKQGGHSKKCVARNANQCL